MWARDHTLEETRWTDVVFSPSKPMAYTNPPSLMHCTACARRGREGDQQGDTCGDPINKDFKPLTDDEYLDVFMSARSGVPLPASHPASPVRERCVARGTAPSA